MMLRIFVYFEDSLVTPFFTSQKQHGATQNSTFRYATIPPKGIHIRAQSIEEPSPAHASNIMLLQNPSRDQKTEMDSLRTTLHLSSPQKPTSRHYDHTPQTISYAALQSKPQQSSNPNKNEYKQLLYKTHRSHHPPPPTPSLTIPHRRSKRFRMPGIILPFLHKSRLTTRWHRSRSTPLIHRLTPRIPILITGINRLSVNLPAHRSPNHVITLRISNPDKLKRLSILRVMLSLLPRIHLS